MNLVTTATGKDLSYRCKGADVEVAGVFTENCQFLGQKLAATKFLTSGFCCYNCYKFIFYCLKVSTVKVLKVVTRFLNIACSVTSCNISVTNCNKCLLQICYTG